MVGVGDGAACDVLPMVRPPLAKLAAGLAPPMPRTWREGGGPLPPPVVPGQSKTIESVLRSLPLQTIASTSISSPTSPSMLCVPPGHAHAGAATPRAPAVEPPRGPRRPWHRAASAEGRQIEAPRAGNGSGGAVCSAAEPKLAPHTKEPLSARERRSRGVGAEAPSAALGEPSPQPPAERQPTTWPSSQPPRPSPRAQPSQEGGCPVSARRRPAPPLAERASVSQPPVATTRVAGSGVAAVRSRSASSPSAAPRSSQRHRRRGEEGGSAAPTPALSSSSGGATAAAKPSSPLSPAPEHALLPNAVVGPRGGDDAVAIHGGAKSHLSLKAQAAAEVRDLIAELEREVVEAEISAGVRDAPLVGTSSASGTGTSSGSSARPRPGPASSHGDALARETSPLSEHGATWRRLAAVGGAEAAPLPAPPVTATPLTARSVRELEELAREQAMWEEKAARLRSSAHSAWLRQGQREVQSSGCPSAPCQDAETHRRLAGETSAQRLASSCTGSLDCKRPEAAAMSEVAESAGWSEVSTKCGGESDPEAMHDG